MADEYIQVSHKNYFQRLGDSFKGIIIGIIFLIGSTYALYWNEVRVNLFDIAKASKEFTNGDIVDNKTLISYTGKVNTFENIGDNQFIKPIPDIVALSRTIEMYAWEEIKSSTTTESASGSSTTETKYSYEKKWTISPQSSAHFQNSHGHENPLPKIPTGANVYKATNINIDTYSLEPYKLSISTFKDLPLSYDKLQKNQQIEANYIYLGINNHNYSTNFIDNNYSNERDRNELSSNNLNNYNSNSNSSLSNPQIGDIRISYKFFPSNIQTTVFGIMDGAKIDSYEIKNEDIFSKMSGGLYRLFEGDRNSALSNLKTEENLKLWITRVVALIFMFMGFNLIFAPINAIFNILKISSVTRYVTGFISFVLTILIASFAILFGKLASFFGFIGAIVMIVVIFFVTIKFVFNKKEQTNNI